MNPIIAPFLPLIAKLGLFFIEYFLTNKVVGEESKKVFIKMAEELRKLGAKNAKSRYETESQIDEINQEWDKKNGS
jgi:hypothetical protein